jgi:hypothetical protein
MTRIPGLSTLIHALIAVCKVISAVGPNVRGFVPSGDQAAYDAALAGIISACDVIRAIDYLDSNASTNPLWGSK